MSTPLPATQPKYRSYALFFQALASRRTCSDGLRQRQASTTAQAGIVVLQPQGAAMEAGDGGGEAEAEAEARPRARGFEAHEALQHVAALGLRNAGAAIRDLDPHLARRAGAP